MAPDQSAQSGRSGISLLGGRRQCREKRQPKYRRRLAICEADWRAGRWGGWAGRRLYRSGCRCLCLSAYCQSGPRHAAYRGLSGGHLAFTSLAPGAEAVPNKMGVDPVRSAVFLDRDGVINQAIVRHGVPHPPHDVTECVLLPGVHEACQMLWAADYLLIVVTNQPDVARGLQSHKRVEAINVWVQRMLPIQQVLTCYHDNADRCECRKPKPGLLLQAAHRWGIALPRSVMVGDRW